MLNLYIVHPVINVRNQLVGSPFEKDVTIECNVEASPKSINYWIKDVKDGKFLCSIVFFFWIDTFLLVLSIYIEVETYVLLGLFQHLCHIQVKIEHLVFAIEEICSVNILKDANWL